MKIHLLFIMWGLWFLSFSSRAILSPLLPIIEDEFAISHALAGGIFFFFSIGATIAFILAGFLPVRIGYKRSIIYCFILLASALFCLGYSKNYALFVTVSFFLGLGFGIYIPCAIPLITSTVEQNHWGKAISFHETAAMASSFAVPLLAAFGLRFFHWRTLFIFLSGACLLIVLVFLAFSPDPRPRRGEKVRLSSILVRTDFWGITLIWSLASLDCMAIYNILPLFLVKERGMDLDFANKMFGLSRIGGLFITIGVGFLMDRHSIKRILFVTFMITGLTTIALAGVESFQLLMTMLFLQATFSSVFFPVGLVSISKMTNLTERSLFTGMLIAITSIIGNGFGPFTLGMVADAWSFQIGILSLGILTLAGCFLFNLLKEI